MKQLSILLLIIIGCNVFAQKVEWAKAPLNPVAFKHTLKDFNLKGNTIAFNDKVFKDGKMFYNNTDKVYYEYNDAGQITKDSDENTYNYNNKGQLITVTQSTLNKSLPKNFVFEYDENGLLKSKEVFGMKTIYAYNALGQLVSEEVRTNGIVSTAAIYSYTMEDKLLKVSCINTEKKSIFVSQEVFYYNNGILVKKIDKNKVETSYKTKTDTQGNFLNEADITFSQEEITKNFGLSVIDEQQISYFSVGYFSRIYINGKLAAFIPVETVNNITVVFDLFHKNYYRIDANYVAQVRETKLSLLATNKEALFVKPKEYNPYHPTKKYYNLIYAGVNRNRNTMFFGPHSKLNVYEMGDTKFIMYDRFFDVNYFAEVKPEDPVYILSEALPIMFYFDARANGERIYHFIYNGLKIEDARIQLKYTNKEQDINVLVDGKLTYTIKNQKALENLKVYYPTIL